MAGKLNHAWIRMSYYVANINNYTEDEREKAV